MNQEDLENQSISRLSAKKQSLDDMYSVPANFLEIDVINPQTTIQAGKKKFTDYEIRMRVSCSRKFLGIFFSSLVVFVPHILSELRCLSATSICSTQASFRLLNQRSSL